MSPSTPLVAQWRWLRAGAFATTMTVLATAAHLLAGGRVPGLGPTMLAGAAVACSAYPLCRRERGAAVVLTATAGAQALLHTAFALPMAAAASTGGGHHGAAPVAAPTKGISVVDAWNALTADTPPPTMLAAHAVAAIVLALALRRGERTLVSLTLLVRWLLAPLTSAIAFVRGLPRFDPDRQGTSTAPTPLSVDALSALLPRVQLGRAPPSICTY